MKRLWNPLAAVQMGLIYVNPGRCRWKAGSTKQHRNAYYIQGYGKWMTRRQQLDCKGHTVVKLMKWKRSSLGSDPEGADLNVQFDLVETLWPVDWKRVRWNRYFHLSISVGTNQYEGRRQTLWMHIFPMCVENPIMTDADMALKNGSEYRKISERFTKNQSILKKYSRAWFKLTHRDLGSQKQISERDIPNGRSDWKTQFQMLCPIQI